MTTWQSAIIAYITHLQAAGRSIGTIKLHAYYIGLFRQLQPAPLRVRVEHLEQALANRAWSPETRKSARSVARSFFGYLEDTGLIPESPARALPSIKVPPGVARPAADPVIAEALADADRRVELMIRLAAYCGLRACEIARVHGRDWDGELLLIEGKGRRRRMVPVLDPVLKMALNGASSWLFPGLTNGHLSPGHVTKLVSAALPNGITCHMLRHRLATKAYAGTRDLLAVQALLGHSKPETTRRYVELPGDATVAAVAAAGLLSA